MLHIILFQPQIPQNTGNIGRTCSITCSRLHLIHPLGFTITDKQLKRSGMDYWDSLDVHHHENWQAFLDSGDGPDPKRIFLMTTHATRWHWDAKYEDGDGLLFGNEGNGAPDWLHESIPDEHRIKIPHFNDTLRSHNLSTAAGIATYEALRQLKA